MIPKIAHWIWLGSNIKFSSIDFIISFFKENPDYQIYIWSDDEKFIKSTLNTRNHGYFSNILVSQRFNIKNIELINYPAASRRGIVKAAPTASSDIISNIRYPAFLRISRSYSHLHAYLQY